MAKPGQHEGDGLDTAKPRGHGQSTYDNKPSQHQDITTGTYKSPEAYEREAHANADPGKNQQAEINHWNPDAFEKPMTTHPRPESGQE